MLGPTHVLTAAVAGAAYATWAGEHVALTGAVAVATSAGWLSPDVDRTKPVKWIRQSLGLQWLLHHRGLTHWWALPVVAWFYGVPHTEPRMQWVVQALILGWASHLLGDFVFGRIPLWPGGPMLGLGLHTGGRLEVRPLRGVLGVVLVWLLVGAPPLWQSLPLA